MKGFEQFRYEILTSAIAKKGGMPCDEAGRLAIRILNYFGFEDEVIDNLLDQEDRKLFYFMQDLSILQTAWEEAILPSGRTWRMFYWILNVGRIDEYASDAEQVCPEPGLYETLPEDAWSRQEA